MNQQQRKYAQKRLEELYNAKVSEWTRDNPRPVRDYMPVEHFQNHDQKVVAQLFMAGDLVFEPSLLQERIDDHDRQAERIEQRNAAQQAGRGYKQAIPSFHWHFPQFLVPTEEYIQRATAHNNANPDEIATWNTRDKEFRDTLRAKKTELMDVLILGSNEAALNALAEFEAFTGESESE